MTNGLGGNGAGSRVRVRGLEDATRKGERVVEVGQTAPSEEATETSAGSAAAVERVVERGVQSAEGQSDRHVLLDDEQGDLSHDLGELVRASRLILGAIVADAAADVARGHRHTACEQRACLKRHAANLQRLDVAQDDSVPEMRGCRDSEPPRRRSEGQPA